jgi:integrase
MRPLSRAALEIINDMPVTSDFVFTFDGFKPFAMGSSARKKQLDELSGVTGWTLHDLRRTHRTLLSRCRVPFEIAERALGHSPALLVKTYDQHLHLGALLDAVEKVAAEIERIVEGGNKGNVLRGRF